MSVGADTLVVLSVPGSLRIHLCRQSVDFRKAHDGLCAIIRDDFREDPFSGDLFLFFNRARDRLKLIVWDQNGFWLFYKRLEKGTFSFPVGGDGHNDRIEITRAQLTMILEGIDQKSAKIHSHFKTPVRINSRRGNNADRDGSSKRYRETQSSRR